MLERKLCKKKVVCLQHPCESRDEIQWYDFSCESNYIFYCFKNCKRKDAKTFEN